jgi:hypothetical protein
MDAIYPVKRNKERNGGPRRETREREREGKERSWAVLCVYEPCELAVLRYVWRRGC